MLIIGALVFSVWWLMDNTLTNLENRGKSLGFGFLVQTAGFEISDTLGTWLFDYEVGVSSYTDIYFIGITNTLLIAVLGIVFASIIGFTVGIMRLSNNFILKYFATVYVEVIRNVPLLLQLFFWYFAALRALPMPEDDGSSWRARRLKHYRSLPSCACIPNWFWIGIFCFYLQSYPFLWHSQIF